MSAEDWILLTNDDGVDSPAILPLLTQLAKLAPVRAVVPARECSWTGKIMSRFASLELCKIHCAGHNVWTLDGYPADCANVGMHCLCSGLPSLLVSGINVGSNAGLAYFLSSGTIGAAVEGVLSGVPAIAFSLQLTPEDYSRWRRNRSLPGMESQWHQAAIAACDIIKDVRNGGLPADASLLSVNMPPGTSVITPRRFARLTPTTYGRYFDRDVNSGRFSCSAVNLRRIGEVVGGDLDSLDRGEVTLTPIRFGLDAPPHKADCDRFERVI